MSRIAIVDALKLLRKQYGPPVAPLADPWQLVLWENVCYLTSDDRRAKAFALLKKRPGLSPTKILGASDDVLLEAAKFGVMAESRVAKLRQCAEIAVRDFDGELEQVFDWPTNKAIKALQKFPGIGVPGAEKVLLFCGRFSQLALESNGLRMLMRLGFGKDTGNYAKSYSLVRKDIEPELPKDLIAAHLLLRQHGQEVCKAKPQCGECVFARECPSCI